MHKEYIPRLVDSELTEKLEAFGAVSIYGPKWCGKTTTAEHISKSAVYLNRKTGPVNYRELAMEFPERILKGEYPRLIDEWQLAPSLWDDVRAEIDVRGENGLFILAGSTDVNPRLFEHSGIGRITRLRMRTMSLFESGNSSGKVSLGQLFDNPRLTGQTSNIDLEKLCKIIVKGGWPDTAVAGDRLAEIRVEGYCEGLLDTELVELDGKRRSREKIEKLLRSVARGTSYAMSTATICNDTGHSENGYISDTLSINTVNDYLDALDRLFVTENLPAWTPDLRSKSAIRTSPVRHMSDPAMAAYFMNAHAEDLMDDPKTLGLLFESLVIRDLRVYSQSIGGNVFHYRDGNGLEADAIIHLKDGRWGAIEVKLTSEQSINEGALNLTKLRDKVSDSYRKKLSFLAVITATGFARTRPDGVHVIPIGCLGP